MKPFAREYPEAFEEAVGRSGRDPQVFEREIEELLWGGDVDQLDALLGCGCCCHEHTFDHCVARLWNGCRGSGMPTRADHESWAKHYERFHGLTRDQFYGVFW